MSRVVWIPSRLLAGLAAVACLALGLAACSPATKPPAPPQARFTSSRLSLAELQKLAAGADPRALGLTPAAPSGGSGPAQPVQAAGADAVRLNTQRPFATLPIEPMRPFVLKTDVQDRDRAVHCMAQAVYYEAAREPLKGQQAVAQVVLNRLRHPAYPKTVCGVVYEGAGLGTGCQFTFTCDGSLRWAPEPALWARSVAVAKRALAGYVDKEVGSATHYHAVYVAPYWAPTLVKMTQVGQHIFYRWTGAWGEPAAFTGRYAGREAELTPALLQSGPTAPPALEPRTVTLALAGEARTYQVAQAATASATGAEPREQGVLYASRRRPTPEEVRAINAKLAGLEGRLDGVSPAASLAQSSAAVAPAGTPGGGGSQ